ncbi:glutaminase [Pullulanibacillus pueri]|uniref:Glutaminase n=1 Tax=Pullulanibacillus pueri TaxID=1437324 RepID=A0A8J3EKY8_9BACL|nr:glutaminase A [Pullulanibacillus pueri]MBM7681171.1 glutaminase [Pullulanibacillus pueri]GGH77325.1 glutaminase [Pullulanibacillus pueri]
MADYFNAQELHQMVEENRRVAHYGEVASYIPELQHADPERLGITVVPLNGKPITAGDCHLDFSLQSISKVISLMVALSDNGFERVFSKVGMEPSGEPFNSISKLETVENHIPLNPMINSGAIAVASLIKGESVDLKFEKVLEFIKKIAKNQGITINDKVYRSEMETGDRNRAVAYFMKSTGIIEGNVDEALDLYFRLCSISVTCHDLAQMAAFLANDGIVPGTHDQLIDVEIIKAVNTIMFTAGMYNESGESAMRTGIPAKSGVSGGILAVAPGKMGIGIIGPAINKKGNSIAGLRLLSNFSRRFGLHLLA